MAETTKSALERRAASGSADLPSLLERLAGDVEKLFDQKVALLRLEIKEEFEVYKRAGIGLALGATVAVVGFALMNIALAFAVSTLFAGLNLTQPAKYALGFIITGFAYLAVGGIVIVINKNRLVKQGIIPKRTINELEKDREWLQKEL